jgi:hypothetical protein
MVSLKAISLSVACLAIAAGSARATPITWQLENVVYADGTTITGTFVYDAAITNILNRVSDVELTVHANAPGFSGTTFGAGHLYDVIYSDNLGFQLANAPANTLDFTNTTTTNCDNSATPAWPAAGSSLPCAGLPSFNNPYDPNSGLLNGNGTPLNTAAFGTSLFIDPSTLTGLGAGDFGLPDNPGFLPGTTLPLALIDAGFCVDAICDLYVQVPNSNPTVAVPGSGAFLSSLGPAPVDPGETPEPTTFVLGGSVLALGVFSRKRLKRS